MRSKALPAELAAANGVKLILFRQSPRKASRPDSRLPVSP